MKKLLLILLFSTNLFAIEGLKVGESAPSLILKDLAGKTFDLGKEQKKTVLVFYRGSWCPYCIKQLEGIQKGIVGKIGRGAQLVAVSVDKKSIAKKMKKKFGFNFPIISDPKAKTLMAFKIVNKINDDLVKKYKGMYKIDVEGDSGEVHHMVAHPAVFIIQKGKIIFSEVNTDYKVRTKNSDILKALK
jgi:peroxiredoxin